MKFLTKELMVITGALVAIYLILTHYTGFSRSIASLSHLYNSGVKTLQGNA